MKLLLDTHILMWTLTDDPRLSASARTLIEHADSEIYYSVISVWETDIKHLLHPDVLSSCAFRSNRYIFDSPPQDE